MVFSSSFFDPASEYNRLKSRFRPHETLAGYYRWLHREAGCSAKEPPESPPGLLVIDPADPRREMDVAVVQAEAADSPHRLSATLRLTPEATGRSLPCRILFLDVEVLAHLRALVPGLAVDDDRRAVRQLFELEQRPEEAERHIARVLSSVPDLEGQVDAEGTLPVEADVPCRFSELAARALVVVLLDTRPQGNSGSSGSTRTGESPPPKRCG